MYKNKRGQVGETMTWAFATVIILIIILISVYISSILKTVSGDTKILSVASSSDIFAEKSLTAMLMTKDSSGTTVYNQIQSDGKLNDFSGDLSSNIFTKLFGSYYDAHVFFGVQQLDSNKMADFNTYFKSEEIARGSSASFSPLAFYHLIRLNDNLGVKLVLWRTSS